MGLLEKSKLSIPVVCGALATLVCMLWGLDFVLIKLGYLLFSIESSNTGDILTFAGIRFIISGFLTLAVLSFVKKKPMIIRRNNVGDVCMLALFQTVGQYVLLYLGMARTSAVHTSIFDSTLVFFSILISGFVFHQEKLTGSKIVGCILGFLGIVVMNIGGMPEKSAAIGDMLVLLCAALTGLSHSLVKKFSQGADPVFLSGWQLLLGGAALTLVGKLMGGRLASYAPDSVTILVALALISSVTGALWNALLKHNPVSSVNIYFFTNPLFGVLFSVLLLKETGQIFRVQSIAALVLICVGILLINVRIKKKSTLKTEK